MAAVSKSEWGGFSCVFFEGALLGVALKGHQGNPFFGPVSLTHSVPFFLRGDLGKGKFMSPDSPRENKQSPTLAKSTSAAGPLL